MIRKRLQRRPNWPDGSGYDPKLTIVVQGAHDVYRLARHLELGQVEFGRLGRAILRSMDQQQPGVVADMQRAMGPAPAPGRYRGRRRRGRQLRLELGMPEEQVQAYAEAVR